MLAEESRADVQGEDGEDPDNEVPIGRVRGDDEEKLGLVRDLAVKAPSPGAQGRAAEPAERGASAARQLRANSGYVRGVQGGDSRCSAKTRSVLRYSLASSALAICAVIAGQSLLPSTILESDIALIALG